MGRCTCCSSHLPRRLALPTSSRRATQKPTRDMLNTQIAYAYRQLQDIITYPRDIYRCFVSDEVLFARQLVSQRTKRHSRHLFYKYAVPLHPLLDNVTLASSSDDDAKIQSFSENNKKSTINFSGIS